MRLLLFFFLLFEIADITMTCIGLFHGNYQHYNPIGIWMYQHSMLWGFILYRAIIFTIVYLVLTSRLMHRVRYPLVIIGLYIYTCAILWDLYTFGIVNLYNEPLYTILRINQIPLNLVFKIIGVL